MGDWIGELLGGLLEVLFGHHKAKSEQMPENIAYVPSFSMRYPVGWLHFVLFVPLFAVVYFAYLGNGIGFALLLGIPCAILFCGVLLQWSLRVEVGEEAVCERYMFFFRKRTLWQDVRCVRLTTQEDGTGFFLLYGPSGKRVTDFSSRISNFWLLVKMAEHLNIEIRWETNLTIRQMRHL